MESCLYTGWVGHRRIAHAVNEFRYSLFFLYLDLKGISIFERSPRETASLFEAANFPK